MDEILMFFREDFPQIKEDGGIGILQNRVPQCPATGGSCYPDPIIASRSTIQSRNMFPNTHKMSQKKLFSYLSRNRIYLNR